MIIFFGDSITRDWPLQALRLDETLLNCGIAGETTADMRRRFDVDVLDRRPDLVHLLGGINDIAENQGPIPTSAIAENLVAMIAAARDHGIRVVAGLLLPCTVVRKRPHLVPQPKILELNDRIRSAVARHAITLADYFTPLVDAAGGLRADCTDDGLHPNGTGYAIMHPAARAALAQARAAS